MCIVSRECLCVCVCLCLCVRLRFLSRTKNRDMWYMWYMWYVCMYVSSCAQMRENVYGPKINLWHIRFDTAVYQKKETLYVHAQYDVCDGLPGVEGKPCIITRTHHLQSPIPSLTSRFFFFFCPSIHHEYLDDLSQAPFRFSPFRHWQQLDGPQFFVIDPLCRNRIHTS